MTECWILYDRADLEVNLYFARSLQENGRRLGMKTHIVTSEDMPADSVPDLIVSRNRDWETAARFESLGTTVVNGSEVIRICNDKSVTYEEVGKLGVEYLPYTFPNTPPLPPGPPWVVKSCIGHGGKDVACAFNRNDITMTCLFMKGRKPIIQQFAKDPGRDLRIYVLGGEILASVLRTSRKGFRANYSLGGKAEIVDPPEDAVRAVEKIVPSLKPDFVGIDFLFGEGKVFLNEIEDAVGCRMLYELTDLDPARLLMEHAHSKMSL